MRKFYVIWIFLRKKYPASLAQERSGLYAPSCDLYVYLVLYMYMYFSDIVYSNFFVLFLYFIRNIILNISKHDAFGGTRNV